LWPQVLGRRHEGGFGNDLLQVGQALLQGVREGADRVWLADAEEARDADGYFGLLSFLPTLACGLRVPPPSVLGAWPWTRRAELVPWFPSTCTPPDALSALDRTLLTRARHGSVVRSAERRAGGKGLGWPRFAKRARFDQQEAGALRMVMRATVTPLLEGYRSRSPGALLYDVGSPGVYTLHLRGGDALHKGQQSWRVSPLPLGVYARLFRTLPRGARVVLVTTPPHMPPHPALKGVRRLLGAQRAWSGLRVTLLPNTRRGDVIGPRLVHEERRDGFCALLTLFAARNLILDFSTLGWAAALSSRALRAIHIPLFTDNRGYAWTRRGASRGMTFPRGKGVAVQTCGT